MLARNWLIPNSNLREFDTGVILIAEQFDVRHLLLAESLFAPSPGARTVFKLNSTFFSFLY